MTEGSEGPPDHLQRVLATTPVGRQELRDPQSGLSLPQRWLLGQLDGETSLGELAFRPGSPAADRLPRDAAKLASLGLALDIGDPGPSASSFGPSTLYGEVTLTLPLEEASPGPSAAADARATSRPQRRSAPALAGAAALLAIGATAVYFSGGPGGLAAQPAVAPQAARGAAAAASVAPAELEPAPVAAASASAVVSTDVLAAPLASSVPGPLRLAEDAPAARLAAPTRLALARPPLADPVSLAQPAPTSAATEGTAVAAPAAPPPAPVPPTLVQAAVPPAAAPQPLVPPVAATVTPPSTPPPTVTVPTSIASLGAGPTPAPTAGPALRPVSLVEPDFPREGLGLAGRAVLVQARLSVAPNGSVVRVSFLQRTSDSRLFERAARSALLQWRFPEGQGERTVVQQLRFSEQ